MSDEFARLKAQTDQALAAMTDVAKALGALFGELVEQGFSRSEALALTQDWFRQQLSSAGEDDD